MTLVFARGLDPTILMRADVVATVEAQVPTSAGGTMSVTSGNVVTVQAWRDVTMPTSSGRVGPHRHLRHLSVVRKFLLLQQGLQFHHLLRMDRHLLLRHLSVADQARCSTGAESPFTCERPT